MKYDSVDKKSIFEISFLEYIFKYGFFNTFLNSGNSFS